MDTIETVETGVKGSQRGQVFERLVETMRGLTQQGLTRLIAEELETEVTECLGRPRRSLRSLSGSQEVPWACHRCGGRQAQDFMRDGHYTRGLQTLSGGLSLPVPMLECQVCGASADVEFAALPKHKQLWLDIDEEMVFGYGADEGMRHIAERVGKHLGWPVSANSVQRRLHALEAALREWRERRWETPPDVLMLDGIWFTVLRPTGARFVDRKGRNRPQQRKVKRVAIIALGLWSHTGETEILDFAIADGEDEDTVVELLNRLHLRGVTEACVKLIVTDGAGGLCAAAETVYPTVARQRCVFHKLKNVGDNLLHPQHRQAILEAAAWIYEADSLPEAELRLEQFAAQWGDQEPAAVASLRVDFAASVAYLLPLGLQEPRRFRTTNALEGGVQRRLRVKLNQATAFHSTRGTEAAFLLAILRLNAHRRRTPWVYEAQQIPAKLYKS